MYEIDQTDSLYRTMFITRILPFDLLDEIGVFLPLDAVVSNDNRGFRILDVGETEAHNG